MRVSIPENHPYGSEHMKDFYDDINDETQGKSAGLEVNPSDDEDL